MNFGAIIIGDEILSGKRVDSHFDKIVSLLAARGLRLSWAEFLGDERWRIAATLKRTFASGDVVFCFGGIGNTPDDHTRQAAAEALGVDLVLHPDAEREIRARFGDDVNDVRLLLGTFPRGVDIVPIRLIALPASVCTITTSCPVSRRWRTRWPNGRSIRFTRSISTVSRWSIRPFCSPARWLMKARYLI